ncbi:energy-coupling factor transporter transmembrane component T family protein [Natranaerofaba carboxydovora]|uniref:energy-coupling factor transporter transmembrane component T family protein n=1 Tax=Natranaerofaba carboxydovora TaxID=2742683 RepID=UPI001F13A76D|nr:energy-coupling factor transporter transmembrane component T [Natranaerofaba carboxydovora]UMZ75424.1 Energy-coupling factor transporter transmembrane protein EcfT [Natranaerofaba carboxydovora]
MFKGLTIGQHLPGNSILHVMDPRMKIMLLLLTVVVLFLLNTFTGYFLLGLFFFSVITISKLPMKMILRGIKPLFFIIAFTFVLHSFLTEGGEKLLELNTWAGSLTVESEGIFRGSFMALRLIFLVIIASVLTLTTSPIALTDAIEHLLSPFKRIGVPAHEIAMMMSIALRFIPTLTEETEKIMKAQKARGADFETGNIIQRAKNLVPLLVPLFVSAFRRADELAVAMEARCYRGGEGRTRLNELNLERRDYLAFVTLIFFAAILIIFGF